jgi:carbonic anhydrase
MLFAALGMLSLGLSALAAGEGETGNGLTGRQALERLMAGNQRYVSGQATHPHQAAERRAEVSRGQHPFAVILACSDSRDTPEIVFDQGLGDLFVMRVAGNLVDDYVLGSIEYAVEHLGTRLIVVMGHSRCGAVEAAVKAGHAPAHENSLIKAILPSVEQARHQSGDLMDDAIRDNVQHAVNIVRRSQPMLAPLAKSGKISVVGARYDLDSGKVTLLP